jgi:AbrB family looped-hinge helix DNA binding protein
MEWIGMVKDFKKCDVRGRFWLLNASGLGGKDAQIAINSIAATAMIHWAAGTFYLKTVAAIKPARVSTSPLKYPPSKTSLRQAMDAVLISTKGQIVLPVSVRKALGLKPGMRVTVKVQGKSAHITPAPAKNTTSLEDIQELLKYDGPKVDVKNMRVTDYKG